ncbi:uncharacterized protein LOC108150233 isoform X2 [Drosophila elegans]|uniref:uncharacterized protein LOC108150233 isoform X2 n=1 Tax=Drosophila elegans TaxID=30023 RepID=UPI0007E75029|nr:uncharacterized protein LOC108150233 isoform X2 [Drosophila elegans]
MTSYANDTTDAATTTATSAAAAAAASAGAVEAATTADTAPQSAVGGVATAADSSKVKSRDNLSISRQTYGDEDGNSSDGREKADTTPENIKKITEIMDSPDGTTSANSPIPSPRHVQLRNPVNPGYVGLGAAIDDSCGKFCLGKPPPSPAEKAAAQGRANHHHGTPPGNSSSNSNSNSNINSNINANHKYGVDEEENSSESNATTKAALAFTIDHFDASENDSAAQAARYKNMMERFQSRHKRGASMSKLETEKDNTTTTATTATSNSGRQSQRSSLDAGSSMADDMSSLTAATPSSEQAPPVQVKMRVRDRSASRVRDASKRHSWSPRSSANAPEPSASRPASRSKLPHPPAATKGTANLVANRTANQFTPRSTAMQLALRQVEMFCPQPPLADGKAQSENDAVSEAGTYTLDGDNYTEEQKDLMNIDRNGKGAAAKQRPKQLPVKSSRGSNVLEVNYYHETPLQEQLPQQLPAQRSSTGAYLDQLKSRVLRQQIPPSPPTPPSPAADMGCFTSVTTSGVLAKQRALDTHPKLTRHSHSLSTSQIDSSEYVSNEAKLRHTQALSGSATDRQKAEYRLNVFTTSTNQQQHQQQQHQQQQHHQLPETPTTPTQSSEAALLQTAQTKQDWIQEWARNARARSLAQDVSGTSASRRKQQQQQQQQAQAQAQQLMTRSYNCSDTCGDSLTDDSLSLYNQQRQYAAAAKLNRSLAERYRLLGDCDYASDPALCSHGVGAGGIGGGQMVEPPYKPPKSPSKIPSPLHTLGRARSASRSRPPTDVYLEQTAAAISNLQQSLSRRSSVKSPAQSSPQHSLESGMTAGAGGGYRRSPLHRALMTSSINEAQLQLLTSGEYLLKQLRRRKNSLEYDPGQEMEPVEPPAAPMSPLRRSSSFQQQQQQQGQHPVRQARPNFQNLYTPPAARHAHALSTAHQQQQQLKKSASSNNFEQAYSDYDNELQYYINDEDELGTTGAYYSSNEEEEAEAGPEENHEDPQGSVPLSNTRMNKALLMRIERSKQRVAGTQAPAKPTSAPAGKLSMAQSGAGLVACPNTPEMPRRGIKSATRMAPGSGNRNTRQSMPRETSLSRLAQQVPSSLANAKKQLLQTASAGVHANSNSNPREQQRVQPKYLDISKYKSAQSNNFLRKNDAKSTLKPADQMKRSPSASSMGLSRGEGTRASNRSVRSAASAMNTSTTSLGGGNPGSRNSSAIRRDASVNKQKEAEMAMWKRRSTYDPMKAAAEDRRRKEEARRAQSEAQRQINDEVDDMPFERPSRSHYRRGQL